MPGADELPENFDVVILGTGLPECMIAAACARSGLSVLQLDRNDYYGDLWASFNLRNIQEWTTKDNRNGSGSCVSPESLLRDGEQFLAATCRSFVENIHQHCQPGAVDDQESGAVTDSHLQNIDSQWRKFSLDLLPKVLLSRGDMVKLLCDSGVAKYCEFKCVDRLLSCFVESGAVSFQVVPCSRGEIFQTDLIPMRDKRRVMRFLQKCIEWHRNPEEADDLDEYADKPFDAYVETFGITGHVKSMLTDTLAILHPAAKTKEGLEAVYQFMESVGRFGDSPFLWTLYGSGELPQCFARLCAVFGGIYCLDRPIDGFAVDNDRIVAVITKGQRISCTHVIANRAYLPRQHLGKSSEKRLNRAILISDRSILPDPEKEHISLLNLACLENDALPYLLEVGYEGCAAPKGKYVTHITARSDKDAHSTLSAAVERLFAVADNDEGKPHILWALYFDVILPSVISHSLPKNIRIVPGVDEHLNYSQIISKTKEIFGELWPDRDFLPPALAEEGDEEREEMDQDMVNSEQEQAVDGQGTIPEQDGNAEELAS